METIHSDIVILGAGIGGYETFRSLAHRLKKAGIHKKITIVDQNNYFTFVPLLHEVAVGSVEPAHAAISLQELVAGTAHRFIKARVTSVDPVKKIVSLDCPEIACGAISYDLCVVALGTTVNYFGVPGAAEHTYHIRSLSNALAFRNALINRYDTPDPNITISVIGGGPSGVEVAGEIAYLTQRDLKKLYPHKTCAVRLVERSDDVAKILPQKARRLIRQRLQKLQVAVITNTGVTEVLPDDLILTTGETVESDLTLWTAGLRSLADTILPPSFCSPAGRIPVGPTLQHALAPSLYAIGDNAEIQDLVTRKLVPQLGEAAHIAGEYVARHIVAGYRHKSQRSFQFRSKGTIMPVGERFGMILKNDRLLMAGFFAWTVRRLVYVWFMPGVVRKIKIIVDWALRLFGIADIISISSIHSAPAPGAKPGRRRVH